MAEWWGSMTVFEKVFWYCAIPFSLIFIIRLAASLLGLDSGDDDFDAADSPDFGDADLDLDGGGEGANFIADFRLFTLQNFVIFFTGFGWAGIFSINSGFSPPVTIIISVVTGFFLMFAVALMYYLITRLTESGNINLKNALNSTGRVYIPIPGQRSGTGQIQLTVQGSFREVEAVTDGDTLPTGTPVKVTALANQDILVVERAQ